jgi:hypothetical protein
MTYQNPQMFIYCHVLTTFLSYANATTGVRLNLPKTKYLVFKGATKNIDFDNLDISIDGTHLEQNGSQLQ